jgi:hypothetical protein
VSISPTNYKQLLRAQIPKGQKTQSIHFLFLYQGRKEIEEEAEKKSEEGGEKGQEEVDFSME